MSEFNRSLPAIPEGAFLKSKRLLSAGSNSSNGSGIMMAKRKGKREDSRTYLLKRQMEYEESAAATASGISASSPGCSTIASSSSSSALRAPLPHPPPSSASSTTSSNKFVSSGPRTEIRKNIEKEGRRNISSSSGSGGGEDSPSNRRNKSKAAATMKGTATVQEEKSVAKEVKEFAEKQLKAFRASEEQRISAYRRLRAGLRNIDSLIKDIPLADQLSQDVREKPQNEEVVHLKLANTALHRKVLDLETLLEQFVKSEQTLLRRVENAEARADAAENRIIDLQASLFQLEMSTCAPGGSRYSAGNKTTSSFKR